MTNGSKEMFLGDQIRALATVILTRREDLFIVETKRETGIDLHVRITREDKSMRLMFGILLRGVPLPVTTGHANRVLGPTLGQFQGMRKFTYPICLFFFTLREEQAFFSWLAEPTLPAGVPKLIHHVQADCVELTAAHLNEIVERIVNWYDAVESVLIA